MRLHEIVETSRRVGQTRSRSEKVRELAACLQRCGPEAIETAVGLLTGRPRQGRIGVGWATFQSALPRIAARKPSLTLLQVDAVLDRIARTWGDSSLKERVRLMGELLARATREEQDFLLRAVLSELRQGALEGLMVEAVALAAKLPIDEIRHAPDEMLTWQTAELQKLALGHDAYTVYVRPELVVEIAFNDIQGSPRYPGDSH